MSPDVTGSDIRESGAAVPGVVAVPEQEWLRLHRRSIWVAPLQPLAGLLVTGLLVITFRGWDEVGVVEPLIGVVVALGAFLLSAWSWATTRYRITGTHVEMRSGMLVRKHRAVARDRLRSVDLTADITHRVAGLAVVVIGTGRQGGDADDEVELDSVARGEAERLREMLLVRRGRPAGTVSGVASGSGGDPNALASFEASWLRLAPFSLLGLVAVGVLLAGATQLLRTVGGDEVFGSGPVQAAWDWVVGTPVPTVVIVALAVLLVLNTVLSTVLYVLFYGGYTVRRADDGTLRIAYGLITHRSVAIEERRIRGVRMDEPLILRLGGGARLRLVAAGLGAKDGDGEEKQDSDLLLPTAPRAVADRVVASVLEVPVAPAADGVRSHPLAALRVLLVRWVGVALVPAVVLER
ncbi:PH domain-containing protein [Pseudonocardia sp. GCM10023141]|uniref:PH domain-containing protein n=1 Tax=Pseudonocardia sp. GCM10023141 TaxID=3252653 RepID=UPI00361454A9